MIACSQQYPGRMLYTQILVPCTSDHSTDQLRVTAETMNQRDEIEVVVRDMDCEDSQIRQTFLVESDCFASQQVGGYRVTTECVQD